jgi:exopolysaccharide biosynthesis polyprenyl glycosylphosphotransferase
VAATDRLELGQIAGGLALDLKSVPATGQTVVDESRAPRWLRALEAWQQASLHPAAMLLDSAVVGGAFLLAGSSLGAALLATTGVVVLSPILGVSARRSSVECQGIRWYLRPLMALCGVLLAVSFLRPEQVTPSVAARGLLVAFGALLLLHSALWVVIGMARRRGVGLRPTLVIGTHPRIEQVCHRLSTYPESGLSFAAAYTPNLTDSDAVKDGRDLALSLIDLGKVEHVLLVSDGIDENVFSELLYRGDRHIDYTLVLPLAALCGRQSRARIGDLGVLPLPMGAAGSLIAKRLFDVVVASLLLVLVAPMLAATALAIWISDRGPVIFRQNRVGRNGKPFTIYKFRSMVQDAEHRRDDYAQDNVNNGLLFKLHDDPRVTPVGTIIRRLSIDELPQLVNVVKGDMSLVGPRPLPVDPTEFDTPAQRRHDVAPGITGLWQVEGANALPYEDMVRLDLTYIATRTFAYDLWLLARTVPALFIRRSAY